MPNQNQCIESLIVENECLKSAVEVAHTQWKEKRSVDWHGLDVCSRHLPKLRLILVAHARSAAGAKKHQILVQKAPTVPSNPCLVVRVYGSPGEVAGQFAEALESAVATVFKIPIDDPWRFLAVRVHFCVWKFAKKPALSDTFVLLRQLLEKKSSPHSAQRQQKFKNLYNAIILFHLNTIVSNATAVFGSDNPNMRGYLHAACRHYQFSTQQYQVVQIITNKKKKNSPKELFARQLEKAQNLAEIWKNLERVGCITALEPEEIEHFKDLAMNYMKQQTFLDLYCAQDTMNVISLFLLNRDTAFDKNVHTLQLIYRAMCCVDDLAEFDATMAKIGQLHNIEDISSAESTSLSPAMRLSHLLGVLCH